MQSFTVHMPLLVATSAFGLGRRRWSSPQQCYLHYVLTLVVCILQLCVMALCDGQAVDTAHCES